MDMDYNNNRVEIAQLKKFIDLTGSEKTVSNEERR
jgi:hypothetical protein